MTAPTVQLLGDAGVGKTAFLKRHTTGRFEARYIPTESRSLTACLVTFQTPTGRVVYSVRDCAGAEKRAPMDWAGTGAFMVMFDLGSSLSYTNARWWIKRVRAFSQTAPILLVGTKSESPTRKLNPDQITLHQEFGIPYVEVSAKSDSKDAPFEWLGLLPRYPTPLAALTAR